MQHAVVYVSGAPGAGKTTVARALSDRLALPLVSKDVLKERLFDSIPAPDSADALTWSRTLGGAAMELLWTLARQPAPVVLEANFRPRSEHERHRLLGLGRPLVEVHCCCPPDLATRRFELRAGSGHRRLDVHPLTAMPPDLLAEFDGPVGLGELVTADTGGPVPLDAVARQVAAVLGRPVPE